LVILDVMMPGMTGLEVLRTIRAEARLNTTRVLMFAAMSDARTTAEARSLGAAGYIVKGVGCPELLAEIRKNVGAGTSAGFTPPPGAPGKEE
jgi:DNA-binding response OmpR family regulator